MYINIENLLKKNNQNLRWLEKSTWISYQALWNIKNWKTKKVSFETIEKLIIAFKCTPNDLFIVKFDKND